MNAQRMFIMCWSSIFMCLD